MTVKIYLTMLAIVVVFSITLSITLNIFVAKYKDTEVLDMNDLKSQCSLKDTIVLRNLILENPELPLIVFVGEDAWTGDWSYNQVDASNGRVEELTLYGDRWMDRDDYEEELSNDLCDEEEYKNLSDEEWDKMIEQKVAETEFVKAIVFYVG